MNYFEGGRWLDGPKLAEWLGPHVPLYERTGWMASLQRRMVEWRTGVAADIFTVDPYLIKLGFHPYELPDELWHDADFSPRQRWQRCRNGHRRTKANTYVRPNGFRECRICKAEAKEREEAAA